MSRCEGRARLRHGTLIRVQELVVEDERKGPQQRSAIRFRKDITRSLIDHHVWLAIENQTIHGNVLNIAGGTRTYDTAIRCFEGNRLLVTDWLSSQTRNNVNVFCDAHRLPFGTNSFDSVLCTEVLEHLQNPRQAVNEIYRVLANGGALLLTTPFQYQAHQRPFDFFRFTYDGLNLLTRDAGFSDVTVLRRGESLAVSLNALKVFVRQHKRWRVDRLLEGAERLYMKWYARKSSSIPLSVDPMALGYTVIARKGAVARA